MTWQDELQHLDAELAAGRISAEEYRARRDALGREQGGQASPPSGVPQQGQSPFPPAFSWGEAAAQGAANAEESTQVVRNPNLNQPPPSGDPTQAVNVNQPPQQPPQQNWPNQQAQWGQQPAWGTQDGGTPWGDSELPPAPEHGDASWMRQGPEVFEKAGKSSKGKLIAGISIGALLVVGVAVAAIYYATTSGQPSAQQQPSQQQEQQPPPTSTLREPPPAKPTPPADPAAVLIPPPPGPKHAFDGPLTRQDLTGPKQDLLRPAVRTYALQNGMSAGWFHGSPGPQQVTLLAVRMPGQQAAKEVVDRYLDDQGGLSQDKDLSYQGVKVVTTGKGIFRTAYPSHDWAVIVAVSAPSKGPGEALFTGLLDQQLAKTPPTVGS